MILIKFIQHITTVVCIELSDIIKEPALDVDGHRFTIQFGNLVDNLFALPNKQVTFLYVRCSTESVRWCPAFAFTFLNVVHGFNTRSLADNFNGRHQLQKLSHSCRMFVCHTNFHFNHSSSRHAVSANASEVPAKKRLGFTARKSQFGIFKKNVYLCQRMDKRLYKKRYAIFQEVLMMERYTRSISQKALSAKLGRPQSYISKVEGGSRSKKSRMENWRVNYKGDLVPRSKRLNQKDSQTRKIDIIELMEYCNALGLTLSVFAKNLEDRLKAEGLLTFDY